MAIYNVSVDNGVTVKGVTVVTDYVNKEVIFLSVVGPNGAIKHALKNMNKKVQISINPGVGYYNGITKGYETFINREPDSDYAHGIAYKKDQTSREGDRESFVGYIFVQYPNSRTIRDMARDNHSYPEEFCRAIFDKLYKMTPVPLLEEWMPYVIRQMQASGYIADLTVYKPENQNFCAYRIHIDFDQLFTIVSEGLRNHHISMGEGAGVSEAMQNIQGLDNYLNTFSEQLARKIQESFIPKFRPGVDSYNENLEMVADYISWASNGRVDLYPAQKAVIQAVSNHLDVSKVAIVVGEMGSGKTLLGSSSVLTNAKKSGSTTIVMCPGHLVEKWKNEVTNYLPLCEAIVVDNFDHFLTLEDKINDPKRRKHLFLIISKEMAKFGYDARPAAVWSQRRNCYVCPECGKPLYRVEIVGHGRNQQRIHSFLGMRDFLKPNADNQYCTNEVHKRTWDEGSHCWVEETKCGSKLWTPMIRENDGGWIKVGKQGWVERRHLQTLFNNLTDGNSELSRKDAEFLNDLVKVIEQLNSDDYIVRAPRKYPLASYIKKFYKGKIDYFIADEVHEYKAEESAQGQAFGDLVETAKKTICLTGTLLNGYASGLYYILYRCFPATMLKEGFSYSDILSFRRQFGVYRQTQRYRYQNQQQGNRINSSEKELPGVSPIVFTKFLLENGAFIGLDDISDGLPGYQEIPIPVDMDTELVDAYRAFEQDLRRAIGGWGGAGMKVMAQYVQSLLIYPDQPFGQPPVIHPDSGRVMASPQELPRQERNKEQALLDLVRQKHEAGEKVLVYYQFTNRTDLGRTLREMLEGEGFKVAVLDRVESREREAWIKRQVENGIDVMICNPKKVETGLDLLDFTTIVFYQTGDNLFTLRQASRRSWRLSQDHDVEVYFMFYRNTTQESALSLMATKLQAAMAIEGKFSEEGLNAMSNNEDFLTQVANSVVQGIRHTVDAEVFQRTATHNRRERVVRELSKFRTPVPIQKFMTGQAKKRKRFINVESTQFAADILAGRQSVVNLF